MNLQEKILSSISSSKQSNNFIREYKKYGHFTTRDTGLLCSDGYYQTEDEADNTSGQWISALNVDWNEKKIYWHPLCRSESSWSSQCAHPHPIFDRDDKNVYFTSDKTGKREVFKIKVAIL